MLFGFSYGFIPILHFFRHSPHLLQLLSTLYLNGDILLNKPKNTPKGQKYLQNGLNMNSNIKNTVPNPNNFTNILASPNILLSCIMETGTKIINAINIMYFIFFLIVPHFPHVLNAGTYQLAEFQHI